METALYAVRRGDAISILNPAPAQQIPPQSLNGIDIITPNEVEIFTMAGSQPRGIDDIGQIAERYARYVDNVIVTLGERGALIAGKASLKHVKSP